MDQFNASNNVPNQCSQPPIVVNLENFLDYMREQDETQQNEPEARGLEVPSLKRERAQALADDDIQFQPAKRTKQEITQQGNTTELQVLPTTPDMVNSMTGDTNYYGTTDDTTKGFQTRARGQFLNNTTSDSNYHGSIDGTFEDV